LNDDPEVLKAIERDLRHRYAKSYRILSANSGQAALDLLDRLRERGEPVALLLADHRMPLMTGIESLSRAVERLPEAKRVLLTAYADTDAAIRAINEVKLHESVPGSTCFQVRLPIHR
jgi:thioredoxin reductase (NADPH)